MLDIAAMAAVSMSLIIIALRVDDLWLSLIAMLAALVAIAFTADIIGSYLKERYNDWDNSEDDDGNRNP